jgi:hypothetical protein
LNKRKLAVLFECNVVVVVVVVVAVAVAVAVVVVACVCFAASDKGKLPNLDS